MVVNLLAIDPGEKHNGFAMWNSGDLTDTDTLGPDDFVDFLWHYPNRWDQIVMEEYRLYPWLLQQQGFSAVETVEIIGVVKHLARQRGWPVEMQPASIKKPAEGITRTRGIRLVGRTRHARDAELHGWYWILKKREADG